MSDSRLFRLIIGLAFAALVTGVAATAFAFAPTGQNDLYEIRLEDFGHLRQVSFERDLGVSRATGAVAGRYGGNWHAYSWNSQTGTPRFVYGTGAELGLSVRGEDSLAQAALQVVAENPEVFRAEAANLRLLATPAAMGKRVAHFQQTHDGVDVVGGRLLVGFSDAGRLLLMSSDYHGDIDVDVNPALNSSAAGAIARGDLPFNPATDRMDGEPELLVLPLPLSATEADYRLVWRLRVRTETPVGIWVTDVDAHTGEIVQRLNDVHFAYGGSAESDAHEYGYCDGAAFPQAASYLYLSVDGAGPATTDENGDWSVAGSGGDREVTAAMEGPWIHVYANDQYPLAAYSGTAQEDVPFPVMWDDTNSHQDERDVFDSVNDVRDFMRQFDPGFGYINQQMQARVSINDACNAFWDGTINFFRQAGGCANTGELQQVVHHEFGHGVQWFILGFQGNEGLGEGNSDILGNLITQDSVIGRGFNLGYCGGGIRNSLNNLQYPEDLNGSVHHDGQIMAGFNWDSMVLLQDAYGMETGTVMSAERWHFGRILLQPTFQPDQVFATFFADDNDGNMDNGTPNHSIFCEAAENHGFDCPNAFQIFEPQASTVWTHDEPFSEVVWSLAQGATVDIDLYRGSDLIANLVTGTPNDGNEVPPGVVNPAWGSGDDFRVRVTDAEGRYGYTEEFGVFGEDVWWDATQAPLDDAGQGNGVAWADHDGDGSQDIYLANTASANHLFANDGAGVFTDASAPPLDDAGSGRVGIWGDYDNDGDPDLYLVQTSGDANMLMRNDGGGVFVDVTNGPLGDTGFSSDAAWADYDNDGLLDLYLVNNYSADKLMRNEGGDVFSDATSGPLGDSGSGRSASWGDYDGDGDQDLFLAHYSTNRLYRNDGGGSFVSVPIPDLGGLDKTQGGSFADVDGDGDLDLYLTREDDNRLFRNDGGVFVDATVSPLDIGLYSRGAAWTDYDNDGLIDLFVANDGGNSLLRNLGGGTFGEASSPVIAGSGQSRGAAWADMDADGDLDLYVADFNGGNHLYRNDDQGGNHWLHVTLQGVQSNRDGVGARLLLTAGGVTQVRQVGGDAGHLSQNSKTVEFGLGAATEVTSLEIRWPSGIVQTLGPLTVDWFLEVVEDATTATPDTPLALGAALLGSHPNPFNPKTTVAFSVDRAQNVRLAVYDPAGREVAVLADGLFESGRHEIVWDGTSRGAPQSSGVYFVRFEAEDGAATDKIVLLK